MQIMLFDHKRNVQMLCKYLTLHHLQFLGLENMMGYHLVVAFQGEKLLSKAIRHPILKHQQQDLEKVAKI